MLDYLDTSAFIKLVRAEPESSALREDLSPAAELVSSALLGLEARRAAARYGEPASARAEAALATVTLVPIDPPVLDQAARLTPVQMRSLDALHLATALSLGDDLAGLYCYDERLAAAAAAAGVDVRAPR